MDSPDLSPAFSETEHCVGARMVSQGTILADE